jgi:hypothetical protein
MSKIPHGEPHAGKLHVAPSLCYGVTGRFDEGPDNKGRSAFLYTPWMARSVVCDHHGRSDEDLVVI